MFSRYISNDRVLNFSLKKYNNAPWSKERKIKYYSSGREAIISLLDIFVEDGKKEVVLLPAYVPQGLYAPFEKKKWKIVLYPIDEELNPIWSEVESLIKKHTPSLAVLIHYFGTIQPIEKFVQLCDYQGVKVIEDYTHLFFKQEKITYKGDYILYSLPKMVGVPDGAVLVVRDSTIDVNRLKYYKRRTNCLYLTKQVLLLSINSILSKIACAKLVNIFSALFNKLFNSYNTLMRVYHRPNKMSVLSQIIVNRINFDEVIKTRSRYARMYDEKLTDRHLRKILRMGSEDCAIFSYPILVEDRDSLYWFLAKKGIYGTYLTSNWNYIPEEQDKKSQLFKNTEYMINHHFLLPTALHLKEKDIEKIIDCVNEWDAMQ